MDDRFHGAPMALELRRHEHVAANPEGAPTPLGKVHCPMDQNFAGGRFRYFHRSNTVEHSLPNRLGHTQAALHPQHARAVKSCCGSKGRKNRLHLFSVIQAIWITPSLLTVKQASPPQGKFVFTFPPSPSHSALLSAELTTGFGDLTVSVAPAGFRLFAGAAPSSWRVPPAAPLPGLMRSLWANANDVIATEMTDVRMIATRMSSSLS
jgi:hypothetical protein